MKSLANGTGVAQQAHKRLGEVLVVGQHPQRSSIAMHNHFFILSHAADRSVAAV